MLIYLVSGSGNGAGKSTLATLLVGPTNVWSLAGLLRDDLKRLLPAYSWHSKDQSYKDSMLVKERDNSTVREVLVSHGQGLCAANPTYFAERLADRLAATSTMIMGTPAVAVDDVRKVCELNYLKMRFRSQCCHFHIKSPSAIAEPVFENDQLEHLADYVVLRRL